MQVLDKLGDDLFQGRDNQIANLQEEVKQLLSTLKHMKEEMKHKENGISQLKSQLEYQCLGKFYLNINLHILY